MLMRRKTIFKKLSVAIIEPVGGHGGMNYYDFSLFNGLVSAGCDVTLYTCDKTDDANDSSFKLIRNYRKIYGKSSALARGVRFLKGSFLSIVSSRVNGTALFHFHFFHIGILELYNVLLTRLTLGKVVITVHDIESFKPVISKKILASIVYKLAHLLIVHNEYSKKELTRIHPTLSNKTSVIPHGNYLDYAGPQPDKKVARERLNIPQNADVLLFFGQIKEVKGLDVLIKAFALAKKNNSNLYLLIAGKVWKDDFSKYENLIDDHNLKNNCILKVKYIPDEDVQYYYSSADVIVLPYRRIYQSGVLLMAMSFGKAVLTSDIPGMTEIVTDNKTGFVFPVDNVQELARRIHVIMGNKQLIANVEISAKKLMIEKYDWRSVGQSTLKAYSTI